MTMTAAVAVVVVFDGGGGSDGCGGGDISDSITITALLFHSCFRHL